MRKLTCVCTVAFAATVWAAQAENVTLPGDPAALKFAVIGDNGTGDKPQYDVGSQMAAVHARFPFVPGMQPMDARLDELVLNRTWRPALAVTGAEGLPLPASAGNVLRPKTSLALSLRIPPTVDGARAAKHLKAILEAEPPYGARVSFEAGQAATGWHAPATDAWLASAVDEASKKHWGKPAMWMGEGGTIPFMAMLGEKFPRAQFLITGVLGPHANAHGPNEFLHIEYAKKLTAAVADVIAAQATPLSRG